MFGDNHLLTAACGLSLNTSSLRRGLFTAWNKQMESTLINYERDGVLLLYSVVSVVYLQAWGIVQPAPSNLMNKFLFFN